MGYYSNMVISTVVTILLNPSALSLNFVFWKISAWGKIFVKTWYKWLWNDLHACKWSSVQGLGSVFSEIWTLVQMGIFVVLEQLAWPTASISYVSNPHFIWELNSADTISVHMFYLFLGYNPSALTPKQMLWTDRLPQEALYPKLRLPWEPELVQTAPCVVLILGHCRQKAVEHLFWKHYFTVVNSLLLS